MSTVLLTGGRAASTLELARLFWGRGWRVIMAESAAWQLSRASRAVARTYAVPWPARAPGAFADALEAIIAVEAVDLLLPTCEEIYYVAMARERLARRCRVLAGPIEQLRRLHSKYELIGLAAGYGLAVPETRRLIAEGDLAALGDLAGWVFKPEFSRFAARTVVRPAGVAALPPDVGAGGPNPWVAQRYLEGRHLCSYSVALEGRLSVHVVYPTTYTLGVGAAIVFEAEEHPGIRAWVETFVARQRFTGQIAFDFIEPAGGPPLAIECNPRLTSGVHLLAGEPACVDAFTTAPAVPVTPTRARPAMLGVAMLLYGVRAARSLRGLGGWLRVLWRSREVVFSWRDPLPALWRYVGLAGIVLRARRHGVSSQEAVTLDIEWNGELRRPDDP